MPGGTDASYVNHEYPMEGEIIIAPFRTSLQVIVHRGWVRSCGGRRRENRPRPRRQPGRRTGPYFFSLGHVSQPPRMVIPPSVATPLNHRAAARTRPRVV
jgi:hypothetical protein